MNIIFKLAILFFISNIAFAQALVNKKGSDYKFTEVKHLDVNPVQNQNRTGTCWSFSSLSFMEAEILRKGKGHYNLSEMYIARNAYLPKAINYVRMDGHFNFGEGGEFHDIPYVIKNFGIVPESVYSGLHYGSDKHNHSEMVAQLKAMLEAIVKKPQGGKLTTSWQKGFKSVVDAYLGELPANTEDFKFIVDGKEFTPKSFAKHLDLDMDDYIEITSYNHHPFYKPFVFELPDNWSFHQVYNVPLDDFMKIAENAIMKGYTLGWGADVSEKGFSHRNGLAIVPKDPNSVKSRRSSEKFFDIDGEKIPNGYMQPVEEKWVSQQERQIAFDNKETTDDHGMHIVGIVKDQKGKKYFVVKNSWGDTNDLNGYFFASFPYFRYKTMDIFINKNALPKDIRKKLGL